MAISDIVMAITVTAELTGATMSGPAIAVMAQDLTALYGESEIIRALVRCRRELSRPLTAGAVFERLAQDDGRPSSDEAWAIALLATDEAETVVWNSEIHQALAASRPILDVGDKVGARMAFRDAYDRAVRLNREAGIAPAWSASLGWDHERRTQALESAQRTGLLPAPQVAALLPAPAGGVIESALFGGKPVPAGCDDAERTAFWIGKIKADLKAAQDAQIARRDSEAKAQREDLAERKRRAAELIEKAMADRSQSGSAV